MQVQETEQERRRLARLRSLDVMDSEPEPVFDALVRIAASVCGKPIALISLIDDRRQWFKANLGLEGTTETPRDVAFCAHAIEQDGVMEVPDAKLDPRFSGNPLVLGEPAIRFYAGAPIVMPSGERIGTLCVIDRQPGHLTAQQAATLQDLALVAQRLLLQRERLVDAVSDVTAREQSEVRLRAAHRFLERTEWLSGVGGWEADLRTRQVKWTDQNCRIFGLEPGHQPGFDDHLQYFGPEARRLIEETSRNALSGGEPWNLELPMVTARGRSIWVRSRGYAEFEDGRPVRLVGTLLDITPHKAARDQLSVANALLTSVVDSLPCGLSVFDGELHLIAHNRQFRTLQDFPDSLFSPPVVTFESLIRHNAMRGEYGSGPPEDDIRAIVERARSPQAHHFQRTRPNGVTLDIRGAPLPGGGFVTTYVDVSAAKAAEQALLESEERRKRAMDASRLALWDLDLESGRTYLSENWSELMGGPRQPMVTTASALAAQVPQHDQPRVAAALVAMLKGTADHYAVEHQVRRNDGSLIWINSEGRVIRRDESGKALRVTGTNRDITKRKHAEEQLEQSAAITRATLESTADGIVVLTMERDILLSNRQFLTMWNIPEALENAPRSQLLAHVQTQLKDPHAHAERLRSLHEAPAQESFDLVELLDGRVFEQYGRPMKVGGTAIGRVWSFRDVTARTRADAEIKRAKEAAEAANSAKSEFLDTVSHEIRTPLNGVLGMTRLLLAETLQPQQRRYVELAHSSAQSLLGLINDLLDLGKIESGRMEFEHVEFSLVELARELGDLYSLRAKEKGLAFEVRLGPGVPATAVGDPGRLRQVLNNLLSNALKFTETGSIGLDIDPGPASTGRFMLAFTVRDTGIGIPPAVQQALFQRFAQADSSTTREYGGTGLGLAIVKQLCEQMGGRVTLQSEPGHGASFRCELPFIPAPQRPDVTPAPSAATRGGAAQRSQRILVAEDNATNQIVVKGMLALAGYRDVTLAEDGQQVLDAVARERFDAILMDCRMPVMDGYEAATRLRALGCRLPIIALTANTSQDQREKCLAAGMDDFLSKPMDAAQLAEVLRRWTAATPQADLARQKALDRMGGDEALFGQVLASFIRLAPGIVEQARAALQGEAARELHRHLHSLAGSAAMVGAEAVAKVARGLEEHALAGGLPAVAQGLPALQSTLEDFLAASAAATPEPPS